MLVTSDMEWEGKGGGVLGHTQTHPTHSSLPVSVVHRQIHIRGQMRPKHTQTHMLESHLLLATCVYVNTRMDAESCALRHTHTFSALIAAFKHTVCTHNSSKLLRG